MISKCSAKAPVVILTVLLMVLVPEIPAASTTERIDTYFDGALEPTIQFAKRAKPVVAPLDVHDNLNHSVELITSLVGVIGGSVGSLNFALTGISLTDCALSFNDVDVDRLSCEDFLDILSECESLQNVKPLLKSSKIKYRKAKGRAASSQRPCSSNRH